MVRAKGLTGHEHRIAERVEGLCSHTIVFDRDPWTDLTASDLHKACEWAGREAIEGYTRFSMQEDEKVIIFTASKPE